MTQRNQKANVAEELRRAAESLAAADLLAANDYHKDAVSRLYYFVFHTVKALLFSKGLEPKTHEGVDRLLSLHFVKKGLIKPGLAHTFARLMKYREEADYNPSYTFSAEDYRELKKDAQELHHTITSFLSRKSLL
mgnify:CR=1 FL=1